MRPRRPPPTELGPAFSIRQAAAAGWTRAARDHPAFERPFRGSRLVRDAASSVAGSDATDPELLNAWERMMALQPLLPDHAFFYGPSAALLWRLPLPRGALKLLHVGVPYPFSALHRSGVVSTRMRPQLIEVQEGLRFRALSPATAWASLAPFVPDDALVAVADALRWVPRRPGTATATAQPRATDQDLESALRRGRWVGVPRLRAALAASRDGCASPQETRLRLLLCAAGLPEPELNQDVVVDGRWLACMDLVFPAHRVGLEYQSAYHREAQQYSADIDRRERLTRAGWTVIEVTNDHLSRAPHEVVRRVRSALMSSGYRA